MNPNTFSKQLLFTTVRIIANIDDHGNQSIGTGFLVEKKVNDTHKQIFLVTNKHVIAKADTTGKIVGKFDKGSFSFIKNDNNSPKLRDSVTINIENLTESFFQHPDENVDLAIFNISNLYNLLTQNLKQDIFIRTIPLDMIPVESQLFDSVEDVLFVGYPNGIYDEVNHLPIMRRGITASPIEIDFNGLKRFLIDAQVFPGSSGSPVFIKAQNPKNGVFELRPDKYFFVGVISKTFYRNEAGEIFESVAPTSTNFAIKQMIGLGICEKSSQITDLIEVLNKNDFKQHESV